MLVMQSLISSSCGEYLKMKTEVTSTIRNPVELGIEKRDAFVGRKSAQWTKSVIEILRMDESARKIVGDVSIETTKDGFIGIIDNPAAMGFEFGIDEVVTGDGVDTAITPELAPMRRALVKL